MEEDFKKALKDFGVPDYAIELSVLSAKAIVEGEFEKTSDIFHNILGKKATSLSQFISEKYGV